MSFTAMKMGSRSRVTAFQFTNPSASCGFTILRSGLCHQSFHFLPFLVSSA